MTENQLRSNVVSVMKGWLGWSEANGKFKNNNLLTIKSWQKEKN